MKNLVLHDRRLKGKIAGFDGAVITLDGQTSLQVAFAGMRAYTRGTPMHSLFIACHGYAGSNERRNISADAGGMGLQLGKEDVTHANVNAWTALKNVVKNIVVYSCAAANTEAGNEFTKADGRYLMGALALHTNARVFAADKIQWYHLPEDVIDFGAWEGQLWRFGQDGSATPVRSAVVDMSVLMGRRALP